MSSTPVYMLSTKDNPYDPFVDYDSWFAFDTNNYHNSCAFLDRIANTSSSMTEYEQQMEINRAIDEIVTLDPTDTFIRLERGMFKPPTPDPNSKEGGGVGE